MAKFTIKMFSGARARARASSPITSASTAPTLIGHGHAPAYERDTKSELFLLAVTNMVGEHTYYEKAGRRDERYVALVRQATAEDPDWTARFLHWLRSEANMRTAALVGAAEFTKARLDAGQPGLSRQVIDSVLQRADEPGDLLAYWLDQHGRSIPKPVKRGVSDAVWRLYTEHAYAKWDSDARAVRFADVLNLVHPTGSLADTKSKPVAGTYRAALYQHILDVRGGTAEDVPDELATLGLRAELMRWPVQKRRDLFRLGEPDSARSVVRQAGITWEALAGWLQGPMTAETWTAIIPSMGYMALLRNLRNFDWAGLPDRVAADVAARIADPEQVASSRQFPMRFLAAHRAVPSPRWAWSLEQALAHSLANIPTLPGRTLVLIDTSASMNNRFSEDGALRRWDAAAVFGIALGTRCERADVVSFSSSTRVFDLRAGESLLKAVDRWKNDGFFLDRGTKTVFALTRHLADHDRVVILTDEQDSDDPDVTAVIPPRVPLYTWNLAGYRAGNSASGSRNRHTFGGLTDQSFRMIPLLEAASSTDWPF